MKFFQPPYRNLLRELTLSQLKHKDQSTFFGFIWSFLNPLLMVLVLYIFFQTRLADGIEHFPLYLLIGIVHYNHFSTGTNSAMRILYTMRALTSDTVFPKEIMVIGSVLANSVEFVLELAIIVVFAALARIPLTPALLWLPLIALLQISLVLWVSLALSCTYIFVRDIEHLYTVFLRLLFFMTPIFYAPAFLGATLARLVILLNPLAQLMTFTRMVILEGTAPPPDLMALFFGLNLSALFLAIYWFKRMEPRFAENV